MLDSDFEGAGGGEVGVGGVVDGGPDAGEEMGVDEDDDTAQFVLGDVDAEGMIDE